jgi:hypothetical protein
LCAGFFFSFIRPEIFSNRLLHDRDRGRRHGHDLDRMHCDFPVESAALSKWTRWRTVLQTAPLHYFQFSP